MTTIPEDDDVIVTMYGPNEYPTTLDENGCWSDTQVIVSSDEWKRRFDLMAGRQRP